ncbi:hypothetical protein ACFL2X_05550 [Candidatus Latescibacterota bacterium]
MGKKSKKKKKENENITDSGSARRNQGLESFSAFITGSNGKWLFFAIYLMLTIFLFRDFLFSNDMLYGSDTIPDGIYTRQYYKDYHEEFGGIPRWNSFLLGGLPFIDAMHGDTFYPAAWLKFFIPLKRALGYKLILHVLLAGIFMYTFLRTLKLRNEAAFLGGLMYMLAPSFVTWLYGGHDAKMYVIAFLPLAFTFLEMGMNKPKFSIFTALGAVMGLLILTSQIQMAYYAYWAIGLYFFFRLFVPHIDSKKGMALRSGFFACAILIAVTLGAVQLLPSFKYSTSQSVRAGSERTGYEYATSFSMNSEEVASMAVPSFSGSIDGNNGATGLIKNYWGKNALKLNTEYHGIIPLIFAILSILVCRNRLKWFFLSLALLSFIYAVGASTPVYRLFYVFVPGIKNFRAPSMIIFLFCFAAVVLTSQFISSLLDSETSLKTGDKRLIYTVLVVVAVSFFISVLDSKFFGFWQNIFFKTMSDNRIQIMNANVKFFIADLWRVVVISSAALLGTWMFLAKKIGSVALVVLIALASAADGLFVDSKFTTTIDPMAYPGSAPDNTIPEIRKIMAGSIMPFRILSSFVRKSQNYYAMFGIQTANGMHNNELQTYERFKGGGAVANYASKWIVDNSLNPDGLAQNNFLKVAGVKYIVLPANQGRTQLFENKFAFDRAYVVHEAVAVKTDEEAIEMMKSDMFNPAKKVIITGEIERSAEQPEIASTVEQYTALKDGFRLNVNLTAPGFVVLTENIVPFWSAAVDGNPVKIHKAYGTFMTVECPEGNHEITFSFRSEPYETGKKLTLASLAFVVVSLGFTGVNQTLKRKKLIG